MDEEKKKAREVPLPYCQQPYKSNERQMNCLSACTSYIYATRQCLSSAILMLRRIKKAHRTKHYEEVIK